MPRPIPLIQVRNKLLDPPPEDPLREDGRSGPGAIRCDRPTLVAAMPVSLMLNCQRPLYQERALGCLLTPSSRRRRSRGEAVQRREGPYAYNRCEFGK